MEQRIKVSVGMVTYNHEAFLAEAIESILMQETDFPFEIVIGEDCSTDRTREILLDFANRYPDKIRFLLRDHNVGAEQNFLEMIKACRGEYVANLDGDDFWTARDKLQRQADFLDTRPDCAMCFHAVDWLLEDGTIMPTAFVTKKRDSTYTLRDLLQKNFISSLSTMTRAECFTGFPEWHNRKSGTVGDWVHHILVATHGDIGYDDKVMGVRRVHAGGVFAPVSKAGRVAMSMRTLELLDQELGYRYSSDVKRSKAQMYLDLARSQLSEGERDDARKSLSLSVKTSPIGSHTVSWTMANVLTGIYFPYLVAPLTALKRKLGAGS